MSLGIILLALMAFAVGLQQYNDDLLFCDSLADLSADHLNPWRRTLSKITLAADDATINPYMGTSRLRPATTVMVNTMISKARCGMRS